MLKKLKIWILSHKAEATLLLIILFVGAYLRLWRISDYMTFLGDEGRDVLVVKRMIVDHKFTLLGPTASVGGFFLGPIYYYFMLPFLWLWRLDPAGPAIMVALFGIATIFLVYKVGKDFFDTKTGLIAASLYTLSPLIISYSRSSWNPNLMPFFSLLIIYFTWQVAIGEKWSRLFWLGLCFGIAFQIHYLATFLTMVVLVYFLFFGKFVKQWRKYLLVILGFIIGWSPFLAFEVRHDFTNFQTLWKFIFSSGDTGFVFWNLWPIISDATLRLFSRIVTFNHKFLAEGLLLLVAVTFVVRLKAVFPKKDREFKTISLLLIWLAVGVGLFALYQKPIYDYYFGFMFVLPFLLLGKTFSYLSQNTAGKLVVIILLSYLLWINWGGRPFRYHPNQQLAQAREISRFVYEKTGGKSFNFALITGQNSDHAYRFFLESWRAVPVVIENTQVDPQRHTVTDQLLVVCESLPCFPLGNSLWEIAGFGRAEIAGEWDVSVVKVYRLVRYKGPI